MLQETKRPSKEMQVTIARQLCLDPSTVSNFFMNARRRSIDKWKEDPPPGMSIDDLDDEDFDEMEEADDYCTSPTSPQSTEEITRHHQHLATNNQITAVTTVTGPTILSTLSGHGATTISMQAQNPAGVEEEPAPVNTLQQVVQQQHPPGTTLTLTRYPDGTFKATPVSTSGVHNSHNTPTAVLLATANPAAVVQQLHPHQTTNNLVSHANLTSTSLDL